MRAAAAALALLLALAAGAAQARDADPVAVGRYHLRKANQLAGEDHCRAAIHEYTLAYEKLKDPVVLFNRGECYRRLGQAAKAVSDYRAFLEAVPRAPNRSEVEARIAALAPPPRAPAAPVAVPPEAPPPAPGPAEPAPAPPVAAAEPPPPPPSLEPPPPPSKDSPPAALAQPVATPEPEAQIHQDQPSQHDHTWMWIALGAAVAGGAVGAYFALRPPATTPPVTDLGNYKF